MIPSFDIKLLDYGALGAAVLVLGYVLHVLNRIIKIHNDHMDRLMGIIEQDAIANTKLASAVADMADVVHDKLSAKSSRGGS